MTFAAWILASLALAQATLGPLPAGALRVYLVRHGQSFSNLEPAPDLPADQLDRLTDLGHEQSRRAGAALRDRGVALVLSSPAGRAKATAEEIRAVLSAPPVPVEPRLRPLALGRSADGKPLDWDRRIAEWKAGRDPTPDGGESMEQVGQRVHDLLRSLARERAGRSLVLVTHSEVIGALVGRIEGTPPAKRYPPQAKNGSITAVEIGGDGTVRLLFANQAPAEAPAAAH
jgi:broad specificity phosphatase PhoE